MNFDIDWDYWIIGMINIVSLWEREKAIAFIKKVKENMKKGAYLVLTGYLKDDVFYKDNSNWLFFDKWELLELFSDFNIKIYEENSFLEWPHEWYEYEHTHSFCKLVACK